MYEWMILRSFHDDTFNFWSNLDSNFVKDVLCALTYEVNSWFLSVFCYEINHLFDNFRIFYFVCAIVLHVED